MIADIQTPAIDLSEAPELRVDPKLAATRSDVTATQPQAPDRAGPKMILSVAMLLAIAGLIVFRAPEISRASTPETIKAGFAGAELVQPSKTASAAPTLPPQAVDDCANQVWPYFSAACLQSQAPREAARVVSAGTADVQSKPQVEAKSSPVSERSEPGPTTGAGQPSIKNSGRLTRSELRAWRVEQRRARYEDRRARSIARFEERRARYEEHLARRYQGLLSPIDVD